MTLSQQTKAKFRVPNSRLHGKRRTLYQRFRYIKKSITHAKSDGLVSRLRLLNPRPNLQKLTAESEETHTSCGNTKEILHLHLGRLSARNSLYPHIPLIDYHQTTLEG